ncbi:conserved hypothetical protein [Leishmania major strain Friedlin]|uniref:BAR domain-containing protein n=1 Tax=Leishmania major TaxID=5664 RepID=Q4QB64_LEIMA|nr:conserved hypothetical protein [Leishmania major strain Friedlin]CAG9574296.1 hypothetical_protein_-_conserved [Leishmania major strain Friedlin]CAJ04575.1 conserved hypothetical protein [Leishmania major strain Friedlin]|eukprot:XP_001683434.1 conserved hypothetical protein [Leishmania major strain Friedlin]
MLNTKSPSPANSNYDFALRHERVKLIARALKQFGVYITRTTQAMREVASCLSLVGQSYHEVAQCVNNTNPHSRADQDCYISFNRQLVESYGANLQNAATLFSAEMMNIKNGEQFLSYNKSVHRTVMTRLHDVLKMAQRTRDLGDDVKAELKKATSCRKVVSRKEAKYIRKGRPLTESKLYVRQSERMRKHDQAYEAKLRTFDTEYESLMQRQLYVAGHTMDDFLDMNTVYLSHILKVLGCLAPNGAEAIQKMLDSGEKLSDLLGIAPEDQLGCRLRAQNVDVLNSSNVTPVKRGVGATPGKGTPAKSSCCGSSHNFTSYYQNRRQAALYVEGAPPTARALGEDSRGSSEPCQTLSETPERQLISNQTPLRATFGSAAICRAASHSYSAAEPAAPSPLQPPSFPAAVRRVDAAPVPYVKPLAIGLHASCGSPGTTTDAAKQTCPAGNAAPAAWVVKTGGRRGSVCDTTNSRTRVELSLGHAQFDDDNTAAGAPPAACLAPAPPPAQYSEERPMERPLGRSEVPAAQAAMFGLDVARSAAPFDDQLVADSCRRTSLLSLKPVALFPLDVSESSISRKVAPRTSAATTSVANPSTQQRSRRDRKKHKTTKVVAAARGVPLPGTASAPPDEDTMSRSTSTQSQEALESSIHGYHAAHYHCPPPQQLHNLKQHPQRDSAPVSLAHFQMELTGCSGDAPCQWRNDGLCSEAGGVSGRSQRLSTSYGLDSPTPTPQPFALGTHAWEDSQVRPCSSA